MNSHKSHIRGDSWPPPSSSSSQVVTTIHVPSDNNNISNSVHRYIGKRRKEIKNITLKAHKLLLLSINIINEEQLYYDDDFLYNKEK